MTSFKGRKCVFFDRDGVLNHSLIINGRPFAPRNIDEFKIIPGSTHCVNSLKKMGYLIIVITNQPDLSTGKINLEILNSFHEILNKTMQITEFFYCPHTDKDHCSCRKPKIGLLQKAIEKYDIDVSKSYFIGDRWRDVECAKNAFIKSIFIDYGYEEKLIRDPDIKVTNINQVLDHIKSGD